MYKQGDAFIEGLLEMILHEGGNISDDDEKTRNNNTIVIILNNTNSEVFAPSKLALHLKLTKNSKETVSTPSKTDSYINMLPKFQIWHCDKVEQEIQRKWIQKQIL